MLRPVRTVFVTTKEELDAALATADQITVEGDDELLSYAVNQAAGDPENHVAVEVAGPGSSIELSPKPQHSVVVWIIDAGVLLLVLLLSYGIYTHSVPPPPVVAEQPADEAARHQKAAEETEQQKRAAEQKAAAEDTAQRLAQQKAARQQREEAEVAQRQAQQSAATFWTNLPSLLWPVVAIVAIVALFLIAWKAISTGSNVTIQWKVTEKVSGRVVITKVRERSTKGRAAA
jgi:cobalamin biosynthesis Mg chelatase CobN